MPCSKHWCNQVQFSVTVSVYKVVCYCGAGVFEVVCPSWHNHPLLGVELRHILIFMHSKTIDLMKRICCVSRFWAALCWITLIEQLWFTCLLIVVEDGRSDLWWALTSHAAGLQSHYYVGIYSVVEVCLPWPCWWIFQGKVYSHFVSLNCVCIYVYKLYCEQQNGARCAQTYLLYLFFAHSEFSFA